jgi:hypothetical protein
MYSAAPSHGSTSLTPLANANAAAVWPDGSEVDLGIRTRLMRGTEWSARSGRRRCPSGLIARLTTAAVTPTDARPSVPAWRPFSPRVTAKTAAAASDSRE